MSGERAGLPPLRLITAPPDRPRARDVTDAPVAEVRAERHEVVRPEPFPEVELALGTLFGDDPPVR